MATLKQQTQGAYTYCNGPQKQNNGQNGLTCVDRWHLWLAMVFQKSKIGRKPTKLMLDFIQSKKKLKKKLTETYFKP